MRDITPMQTKVSIIEYHVNNPDATFAKMSYIFEVSYGTISNILTAYYKRPEFTVIINSDIDGERAIYQESVLSLVQKIKL